MKKFSEKVEENVKTSKPVVLAFGRMNPPTTGHEKLVNRVHDLAKDYGATHRIVLSHSSDAKKNPLNVRTKLKHAQRFFPGSHIVAASSEHPTFLHHAAQLNAAGHDHLIMVAGSDRVDEYEKKLNDYNGNKEDNPKALFNFKKIEVKSAGQRDPDAEGTEGMSASKMREHAKNNDFHSFRQGIPSHVPEKQARDLFRDVRSGMGINEDVNRGLFKAIFVSGGPGSGKDIIIREAIAHDNAVEINTTLAISILNDRHKLYIPSRDLRREAVRNRLPLIINGTTNDEHNILAIKEELEDLGYETMMLFVNASNDASKRRNEGRVRVMTESVRQARWEATQQVSERFQNQFSKYLEFDNSLDLNEATDFELAKKEDDVSIIFEMTNWFFDIPVENETAETWLIRNKKLDVNKVFESLVNKTESKKNVSENKANCTFVPTKGSKQRGVLRDNNCPSCQIGAKAGKQDSVRDGDIAPNTSYTFRTYHEAANPTATVRAPEKETKFQQDADKQKAKSQKTRPAEAGRVMKPAGVSPEYDTRGSGTVYPMSGLTQVTYREQTENKYTSTAEVSRKSFNRFRKESIDSPSVEMGVTGGYHGASNKEPLETPLDKVLNQDSNKKKKKK